MIHFTSARRGTSDAAKRVDARAIAFQRQRAEAARLLAAIDADRGRGDVAEAEDVTRDEPALSPREWAEKQVALWATLQPHIVVSTFKPRWRAIVEEVAERHGVAAADLLGPSRAQPHVRPRQEAMYRIADETPLSLPDIGRRFGGRDHTTALHGVRAHAARHGLPLPRQDEEQAEGAPS